MKGIVDKDYSCGGSKYGRHAPPRAKIDKTRAPVCRVSAEEHAKQFKEDRFVDSGCYSADFVSTA